MSTAAVLFYFQEILIGDLKKQKAQSNKASTGGGARDMRIPKGYMAVLGQMFKTPGSLGTHVEKVYWHDKAAVRHADVELWQPTQARSGECRIAKVHKLDAWKISQLDEADFLSDLARKNRWFYALTLDHSGKLWARIFKQSAVSGMSSAVKTYIMKRISVKNGNEAVRGSIDFTNGGTYPK